jgi:hypothetical protein
LAAWRKDFGIGGFPFYHVQLPDEFQLAERRWIPSLPQCRSH